MMDTVEGGQVQDNCTQDLIEHILQKVLVLQVLCRFVLVYKLAVVLLVYMWAELLYYIVEPLLNHSLAMVCWNHNYLTLIRQVQLLQYLFHYCIHYQ